RLSSGRDIASWSPRWTYNRSLNHTPSAILPRVGQARGIVGDAWRTGNLPAGSPSAVDVQHLGDDVTERVELGTGSGPDDRRQGAVFEDDHQLVCAEEVGPRD